MRWHYIRLFLLIRVLIAAALMLIAVIYFPESSGWTRIQDLGVFAA
jgi:hypothetical protein